MRLAWKFCSRRQVAGHALLISTIPEAPGIGNLSSRAAFFAGAITGPTVNQVLSRQHNYLRETVGDLRDAVGLDREPPCSAEEWIGLHHPVTQALLQGSIEDRSNRRALKEYEQMIKARGEWNEVLSSRSLCPTQRVACRNPSRKTTYLFRLQRLSGRRSACATRQVCWVAAGRFCRWLSAKPSSRTATG